MASISDRRAEAEVLALRRSFKHGFTALDVHRRKWAAVTNTGRKALTCCVNSQSLLGHAESSNWPPAIRASAVRSGVAWRALREQRDAQTALWPVMRELEQIVNGMYRTVAELRARVAAASHVLGEERSRTVPLLHTESADQLSTYNRRALAVPRPLSTI